MSTAIVYDLGYGDSGKGTVVDYLARDMKADLVVRFSGGPQNAHNVVTPEGIHHTFHQFGSGALAGASTYIGPDCIVEPVSLCEECEELGILGANRSLWIDPSCLITTIYHGLINRQKEVARGANRHGSCGWGINEAVSHALLSPAYAIRAYDFDDMSFVKQKLVHLYEYCSRQVNRDVPSVSTVFNELKDTELLMKYCSSKPLSLPKNVIFEGSQGVLLDQNYGWFPYVTRMTTTQENAIKIIMDYGYRDFDVYGVSRTYSTRHGAGPLISEVKDSFTTELHNEVGEWQGEFRKGWLDLVGMRYAIRCSRKKPLIVLTCMDEVRAPWYTVNEYERPDGRILRELYPAPIGTSLAIREASTKGLYDCKPLLLKTDDIIRTVEEHTNCSVALLSHGPHSDQKEWTTDEFARGRLQGVA
jgi:adenylosuccinate synthase